MGVKLDRALAVTKDCLERLEVKHANAEVLLKFARDYYADALHYKEKGDLETSLEAAAYAHGFIDSAVLLGLVKLDKYYLISEVKPKERVKKK
jgi:hypothetical protein